MKSKTTSSRKNKKRGAREGVVVDSKIYWESNPDKAKTYKRKEYRGKKFLTPKQAEIFLEISGEWLAYFMQGKKGFPKLPYTWDKKNVATIKFARQDLEKYRDVLRRQKLPTKASQIQK
jgi:hypothetical protein